MPDVIYIMSDNRSGSTLLENILSKSDECFSVGELAMLKGHLLKYGPGARWTYNCACGNPLDECVFWSPIIAKLFEPDKDNFFTSINWNFKSKALAMNAVFPFFFKEKFSKICRTEANKKVIATLSQLYKEVSEKSRKKFIVDSSKNPLQALAIYKNKKDFNV